MELWVFDRSCPYSSGEFDIHEEFERFIRAIAEYALMNNKELRLNTIIKLNGKDQCISILKDATWVEEQASAGEGSYRHTTSDCLLGNKLLSLKDRVHVVNFS